MSFARWGVDGSDVYVFSDVAGGVSCCGCALDTGVNENDFTDFFGMVHKKGEPKMFGDTAHFYDLESLLDHYRAHQQVGNSVPGYLFDPSLYRDEDFDRRT